MKTVQIGMTGSATRGGGLDRYFFNLVPALESANVASVGFVAGDTREVAHESSDIRSFAPLGSSLLTRLRGVRAAVAPQIPSCDAIVSHFSLYSLPILDLLRDKPFIVHFHGPWKLESVFEGDDAFKATAKHVVEKLVYARGARFVVLSQAFADVLASEYGVSRDAIRIVPGGVDLSRFAVVSDVARARERLGWPADRRIVFSVRRLVHAKGLENLIEAADLVREQMPDALFLIAGTGPLEPALRAAIAERGLEDHVRLLGFVSDDDLPVAYGGADLFVVPTIALEGFGLVVVESLACGTPVLVTPIGGLPEVVRDLDASLVLRSYAARDIADGILAAFDGTRPTLPSRAECKAYAQRFDWRAVAARVADVYREVV